MCAGVRTAGRSTGKGGGRMRGGDTLGNCGGVLGSYVTADDAKGGDEEGQRAPSA
eukprot:gene19413-2205_t